MTGLESLVEKTAAGWAQGLGQSVGNLGRSVAQGWGKMTPGVRNAVIGAGVGGVGGLLSGGPDEHGESHRLRNMMVGMGGGAALGGLGGEKMKGMAQQGYGAAKNWATPGPQQLDLKLGAWFKLGAFWALQRFKLSASASPVKMTAGRELFKGDLAKSLGGGAIGGTPSLRSDAPRSQSVPMKQPDWLSKATLFGSGH